MEHPSTRTSFKTHALIFWLVFLTTQLLLRFFDPFTPLNQDHTTTIQDVNYYCPYCGRWLVTVHPNKKFDIAGKTSVKATLRIPLWRMSNKLVLTQKDLLVHGGTDLRPICRFRAWLAHNPEDKADLNLDVDRGSLQGSLKAWLGELPTLTKEQLDKITGIELSKFIRNGPMKYLDAAERIVLWHELPEYKKDED